MLSGIRQRQMLKALKSRFPLAEICEPFYMEFDDRILFIGDAYVGPHSYWSAKGGITIGDNCIFGPKTTIWTYNHNFLSDQFIPYGGDDILKEVVIEENVWVGLGAIILPGVRIGEGSVVGAGSVVSKDIPKCSIVAGNPAVVIKKRDSDLYEKLKSEGRLYLAVKRSVGIKR